MLTFETQYFSSSSCESFPHRLPVKPFQLISRRPLRIKFSSVVNLFQHITYGVTPDSSVLTKLSTHQNSHFTSLAIPNHNDIKLIKLCTVKYSLKTTGGLFLGQPPNCTVVHYSALQCIITLQLMTVCRQYVEILRPLSTSVTYYAIKVTDIT